MAQTHDSAHSSGRSHTHSTNTEAAPSKIDQTSSSFPSMSHTFSVKLDENNYLIWKNQLLNVIMAHGLDHFIDGTHPCPPRFLDEEPCTLNPEYAVWNRYNRLVMSWFYSSLTESMLGEIVIFGTAHEIWAALEQIYSSSSMARITEIRSKLQTIRKAGLTAAQYIQRLKGYCNRLAAIGEPVSSKDQLVYFLGGLGPEYDAYVTGILNRSDKPSMETVYSLLLSFDYRMERNARPSELPSS